MAARTAAGVYADVTYWVRRGVRRVRAGDQPVVQGAPFARELDRVALAVTRNPAVLSRSVTELAFLTVPTVGGEEIGQRRAQARVVLQRGVCCGGDHGGIGVVGGHPPWDAVLVAEQARAKPLEGIGGDCQDGEARRAPKLRRRTAEGSLVDALPADGKQFLGECCEERGVGVGRHRTPRRLPDIGHRAVRAHRPATRALTAARPISVTALGGSATTTSVALERTSEWPVRVSQSTAQPELIR